MEEIRWFIKDNGEKVLQFLENTSKDISTWKDVPIEYESVLAKHNYTHTVKINRRDIEYNSLIVGDTYSIQIVHSPTGAKVEKTLIRSSFKDREELLQDLLNKINNL